ncbi:hypothetical protein WR25_06337 [Diploscapter pachys]|uniref:Lipase domain-containing protein n=1 Tax=Diploscapter pachys TaxID=2018661 RepID=A0A2A2L9F9_9BILA|nr:hypothetical protein WR25_06337 [Diploscapter pachys]
MAVSAYSKQPVDIVAFSLGSPLTRKAIKGGRCVDQNVRLGRSLSSRIGTFLSVAGANQGSDLCEGCPSFLGASVCSITTAGICSPLNGLNQNSTFLKDVNNGRLYEGKYIISLESDSDEKIGYGFPSEIPGSLRIVVKDKNHVETIFETVNLQIKTIKKFNKVRPPTALEKKREEIWKRNWQKTIEKRKQQQQIKEKKLKEKLEKQEKQKQKSEWKEKPKKGNAAAADSNSINTTAIFFPFLLSLLFHYIIFF